MLRSAPSKITPKSRWYSSGLYRRDLDVVTKLAQRSCQGLSPLLSGLGVAVGAWLDITASLRQDLPHQAAPPMGHRPNRSVILQARHLTAEHGLKVAPLGLHRPWRCLRPYPPHIAVPFRGATAVVLFRTFVFPPGRSPPKRPGPRPRG